jgi:hypothetical protein
MIHGRILSHLLLIAVSFFVEGTQAEAHLGAREESSTSASSTSTSSLSTSTSSSKPTSSSSASSTPTSIFYFNNPPLPMTCGSSTITWVYRGPGTSLDLQVTNVGVSQDTPPPPLIPSSTSTTHNIATSIIGRAVPSALITPPDITMTIATNLAASSRTFVWNPVNVSQGWYSLSATVTSPPLPQISFYVRTGTNTSCLVAISPSAGSATITPASTSAFASIPSQPASHVSLVSNVVNVGIIVGASVGVAALMLLGLWLWCRRKKTGTSSGKSGNFVHRWNGLSSTDSRGGFAAKPTSRRHGSSSSRQHLSHLDSVANTLGADHEDDGIGAEKSKVSAFFNEQGVALSTLPVLYHQSERPRPNRAYSASSFTSNIFSMDDQGGLHVRSSAHRKQSVDSYPPSSPLSPEALRDSAQYMVAPVISSSNSQTTTGASSNYQQTSNDQSSISTSLPLSPSPPIGATASRESKLMNRQSFGRKRKPVPVYDDGEEPPLSSPTSPTFAPPFPHYTTTSKDSGVPELAHKSSFGPGGIEGKPLHYLIPDMPMPNR